MTDQTIPSDARKQAAKAVAFALCPMIPKREFDAAVLVDVALAAAYPLLRQQIETEVRRQVEAEIEQMESAWYFGGPHAPGVRVVSLDGALLATRGAAQPGGTE